MRSNKWNITKKEDYILISKRINGKYTWSEVEEKIDFNKWNVYKKTSHFRRLEPHEYTKYAGFFLSKENIDDIVEWMNSLNTFKFLDKTPNKKLMEMKIIDEIKK